MKVLSVALLSVALYAQTSSGSAVEEMCDQFQGEIQEYAITSHVDGDEDFKGLSHKFCIANFGSPDNRTIWMDAGDKLSLTQPTIAASLYKTIPFLNFRTLMKDRNTGSSSPASVLCQKIGGSQVSDFNLDYGFMTDMGFNPICVFGDGSFIDTWALYYTSVSPVEKDQDTVYTAVRNQIPREMMWPRVVYPVDEDFFIKPTKVQTCQQNSDCASYKNPCQALKGKPTHMVCDTEQNICVAEEPAARSCETDADCLYENLARSYVDEGYGYCLPRLCSGPPGARSCSIGH